MANVVEDWQHSAPLDLDQPVFVEDWQHSAPLDFESAHSSYPIIPQDLSAYSSPDQFPDSFNYEKIQKLKDMKRQLDSMDEMVSDAAKNKKNWI